MSVDVDMMLMMDGVDTATINRTLSRERGGNSRRSLKLKPNQMGKRKIEIVLKKSGKISESLGITEERDQHLEDVVRGRFEEKGSSVTNDMKVIGEACESDNEFAYAMWHYTHFMAKLRFLSESPFGKAVAAMGSGGGGLTKTT